MNFNQLALELARERQERLIDELAQERLVEQRPSIRRSIGRRIIAMGERIAAEQPLELARSR
jgi:DNA-binding IclR family transcriptional regulator